jgi:hypothetical protein
MSTCQKFVVTILQPHMKQIIDWLNMHKDSNLI